MSTPEDWPSAAPTFVNEPAIVNEPVVVTEPVVTERVVTAPVGDPVTVVGPPLPPDLPPPEPMGDGPDDRIGMGMLLGLIVLGLVGVIAAAIFFTRHHNHKQATPPTRTVYVTTVPAKTPAAGPAVVVIVGTLTGQTQAKAVSALRGEGLGVRVVSVHGAQPAGTVVGERPVPGTGVRTGSTVLLLVSDGASARPPTATSPATTRLTTTPAQATTSAQATTVPAATTTVAAAPPPQPAVVQVPDLTGDKLQGAVQSLNKAGFVASIAYVPGSDPLGTILAQQPAAGSSAPTASHLTINASTGPGQKAQETVPDASGQTIPQGVSTMQHAHLRLIFVKKTVTDRSLAGKIVGQSPSAGATAPENAQVLVYMGAFR